MQIRIDTRSRTLIPEPLAENAQWNCWKSNYYLSTVPFLLIITPVIYVRAEGIRSDRELYAYSSNSTRVIIPEFAIHNSKEASTDVSRPRKASLFIEEATDCTAICRESSWQPLLFIDTRL